MLKKHLRQNVASFRHGLLAIGLLAMTAVCQTELCHAQSASQLPRWTFRTQVDGAWLEGTPLAWSDKRIELLLRDGSLRSFASADAKQTTKISDTFQSLSAGDLRAQLQREFGRNFEVSGTGHYLVVHPAGQRDYWADRFEQLYRSFVHYFSVRGLTVGKPEFPMVAIVVPKAEEMYAYAAREGTRIGPGVLGYYSTRSNRVILYDQSGGKADKKNWSDNSDTIIHEATHQTAFNTGIHRRWPQPPVWVAEGLGTLFEAPGVWDSQTHRNAPDRINRGRFDAFKQIATQVNGPVLQDMVATDRLYRHKPGAAYAIGWALTHYLVETQPTKYRDYLNRVNAHTKREATDEQRLADFKAAFGNDFAMLNARFQRFMADLK